MSDAPSRAATALPEEALPWRAKLYRYFFYGWRFRDADDGSRLERAAALRHNRDQAKWLPTYMMRWAAMGAVLLWLQSLTERLWGDSLPSAVLAIALIIVVLYLMITVICWAFLQAGRQSGN